MVHNPSDILRMVEVVDVMVGVVEVVDVRVLRASHAAHQGCVEATLVSPVIQMTTPDQWASTSMMTIYFDRVTALFPCG